jgi:hypothetical protein
MKIIKLLESKSMKEDASKEWKPNTSFKHIKDIYSKVKANDYKYVNNEREEFMAAVKKADKKGYKPEECRQIKDWHKDIWQHNRKSEGWSHFEFTSGSNPYIAKTKEEANRIKRSRGDSVRYVGNIDGNDYYTIDDSEEDLFRVEEGYELSPRIDYNPNRLRDDGGKIMADRWYSSKYPDDEVGIEQLQGITLDDALKDRSILGHCDTQVRERVYAQLDKYVPIKVTNEAFKPSSSGVQSVKCYNRYNYTIQELRVDNDKKTFERGNFTMGKPDKKVKNRQEFEDIVDNLKKLGYNEIGSDYKSMRNKSRKGIPTNESKAMLPRNASKIRATNRYGDKKSMEMSKDGKYWRHNGDKGTLYDPSFLRRSYDIEVLETDPNYKPNKTKPEYVVQGNYGYGWDDLTYSDDRAEAMADLKAYRENERNASHRLITRRVPIQESANFNRNGASKNVTESKSIKTFGAKAKKMGESFLQDLQKDHKDIEKRYGKETYDALTDYCNAGNDLGDVLYKESSWNKFVDWAKNKGVNVPQPNDNNIFESAFTNGQAENGFIDNAKRAGGAKKVWKDALEGKKTKTVKAKDLKPGMITSTGEVKKVTDAGWVNGKHSVEVSYGGIGAQGSHASDCVAADRDYEVLDESINTASTQMNEANGRYYVTIYEQSSTSGPEEGGYTSYGWEASTSKYFKDEEAAKKYQLNFVEGTEILNDSNGVMHIKDEWGDEYKVAIEPANKRGSNNSPARSWAASEMDAKFSRPYFDKQGKRVAENPRVTRQRKKDEEAIRQEYKDILNACKTKADVINLLMDKKYASLDNTPVFVDMAMDKYQSLKESSESHAKTFSKWFDETQRSGHDSTYYPFDNYAKEFENARVLRDMTALDVVKNAHKFYDVYDVDSSDREKAFYFASEELGIDYDTLYYAWLYEKPIEGLNESSNPAYLTDCHVCGDKSFDTKRGRCTKCSYRESLNESENYRVKFFQVFEAPKSPSDNGKMIGQRETMDDANAFGKEKVGEGNYIIKAVCDDGKTRYIDNNTDASDYKMAESLDEASYGGAFDIADDQYFTREDIEEASEKVLDHINETFSDGYVLGGTWFENGKWIVNVQTQDGMEEYETEVPVDMRKVRQPRDIQKYALEVAGKLISQIKEYNGLEEAFSGEYSDKFYSLAKDFEADDDVQALRVLADDVIRYCPEEDVKDCWYDRGYQKRQDDEEEHLAWLNSDDDLDESLLEKFTCADCNYHWKDEDDDYPRCHFDGPGKAPCEEDDWEEEDESFGESLTESEGDTSISKEDISKLLKTLSKEDKDSWASTASDIVDAIPEENLNAVIDLFKSKLGSKKIENNKDDVVKAAKPLNNEVDANSFSSVGDLLDLVDVNKMAEENPKGLKSLLVAIVFIIGMFEPSPVVELIAAIIGILPESWIANFVKNSDIGKLFAKINPREKKNESIDDDFNGALNEDIEKLLNGPEEGPEAGLSNMLSTAIIDEWEAIKEYNDLAINARAHGYHSVAQVIDDINTEENIHVGQLQQALTTLSPNANVINQGQQEARDQMVGENPNEIDDTVEVDIPDDEF